MGKPTPNGLSIWEATLVGMILGSEQCSAGHEKKGHRLVLKKNSTVTPNAQKNLPTTLE